MNQLTPLSSGLFICSNKKGINGQKGYGNRFIKRDKKKKILIFFVSFILFTFPQNISAQNIPEDKATQIKLIRILGKTREYCSRLKNAAFYFVCMEEITEKIDHSRDRVLNIMVQAPLSSRSNNKVETRFETPNKLEENKYVYDYQLIHKDYETKESRILLEENGDKKNEKDAQLKTQFFRYQKVLFGPIDLLSEYWQRHHDYKIVKEEILKGEKAIVIEAIPKPSLKQRHLFGKIWVKESDFSVMKIEWNQKNIGNFLVIEEIARRYKAEPRITLIAEYDIEKKKIRFPSRYFIEEAYISQKGKKFIRSKTEVIYKDYRFFVVETEIKY